MFRANLSSPPVDRRKAKEGVDGLSGAKGLVVQISECDTCIDLADRAFETGSEAEIGKIAVHFLQHAVNAHTGEVMAVLAEKYAPIFLSKRAMR